MHLSEGQEGKGNPQEVEMIKKQTLVIMPLIVCKYNLKIPDG